jgi:perosamine synthetase
VRHHGLVPVPLDVELSSMTPRVDLLDTAAGPKARVLVLAHIFGARFEMGPWVAEAARRGLLVVEDCAEVFEGVEHYSGHPGADLSLFSFGSIKGKKLSCGQLCCSYHFLQ